jgi:hypothetical protein
MVEPPLGAFNSMALSADGKLIGVACGIQSRMLQEVNSYLFKWPEELK